VTLFADPGSAKNFATIGPVEMHDGLLCPQAESSVITGAPIASANASAGLGFTV
jgi:hypothetical protein